MALIQIDLSDIMEEKIKIYSEKWKLNKLRTIKKMLEDFEWQE